jgi:tight adherence protein B
VGPGGILLLLLAVLAVACVGAWQLHQGFQQRREVVDRTALDRVEARERRLRSRLDARLRRTVPGRRLAQRLALAGMGISALDFLLLTLLAAGVAWLLALTLLSPLFALLVAALAVVACLAYLRRRVERRRDVFAEQLPELARTLSNAAAAGLALRTAVAMAAEELSDPAGAELRHTAEALAIGQSLEDALRDLGRRMPSRELEVLVTTLVIQARSGGALVSSLRNISDTLEARKEVRREIKTLLASSVFTSYLVAILGGGTLLVLNLISPGLLGRMTRSLAGGIALLVGGLMYAVGFLLIRRETRIDI